MENQNANIKRLAEELTRLVNFVPVTKDELLQWYEQARSFQESSLLTWAPHFVWHYLADADIRMRDDVYAELQTRRIITMLAFLDRGIMPTDNDV